MMKHTLLNCEDEALGFSGRKLLCPVCGYADHFQFFDLNNVSIEEGILFNTKEDAQRCPTGNVRLLFCTTCRHIWNGAYKEGNVQFDDRYDISLHYSPLYENFINKLAMRLVQAYDLYDKTIIEIGSGKGEFLRKLCSMGNNRGVGFDPTYEPCADKVTGNNKITFIQDFYSMDYDSYEGDFICCRHVLDDLVSPRSFVEMVRKVSSSSNESIVYFEVPNGLYTFYQLNHWNIAYANYSYFTPQSLEYLFQLCGFDVFSVEPCFDNEQYLGIEAGLSTEPGAIKQKNDNELQAIHDKLNAFSTAHENKLEIWKKELDSLKMADQKVLAWGAGARAISFLSWLQITGQIEYVVDINPNKQGKYMPITGQEVVPPEFVKDYKPDVILITNDTFEKEIRSDVESMGLSCHFKVLN